MLGWQTHSLLKLLLFVCSGESLVWQITSSSNFLKYFWFYHLSQENSHLFSGIPTLNPVSHPHSFPKGNRNVSSKFPWEVCWINQNWKFQNDACSYCCDLCKPCFLLIWYFSTYLMLQWNSSSRKFLEELSLQTPKAVDKNNKWTIESYTGSQCSTLSS